MASIYGARDHCFVFIFLKHAGNTSRTANQTVGDDSILIYAYIESISCFEEILPNETSFPTCAEYQLSRDTRGLAAKRHVTPRKSAPRYLEYLFI